MQPVILIPARMGSTRLPNKPMADICGKPMIVQVLERARESGITDIFIAADDERIITAVEKAGGKAILTDASHPSGSDRIWQALQKIETESEAVKKYDVIINLQGDLPTIEPELIKTVLKPLENPEVDIATLVCKIDNETDRNDPSVVKAIVSWDNDPNNQNIKTGKALYFSRCTAPYGEGDLYHHIGIYAYRKSALEKFVKLPPSKLEQREKLEQLRALENNMRIDVALVDTIPLGVDTAEHLQTARRIINESQ